MIHLENQNKRKFTSYFSSRTHQSRVHVGISLNSTHDRNCKCFQPVLARNIAKQRFSGDVHAILCISPTDNTISMDFADHQLGSDFPFFCCGDFLIPNYKARVSMFYHPYLEMTSDGGAKNGLFKQNSSSERRIKRVVANGHERFSGLRFCFLHHSGITSYFFFS